MDLAEPELWVRRWAHPVADLHQWLGVEIGEIIFYRKSCKMGVYGVKALFALGSPASFFLTLTSDLRMESAQTGLRGTLRQSKWNYRFII